MVEDTDEQLAWEQIPPELAAVARRSGISAAELLAFRDDPENQDTGLPDLDDGEWDLITAPVLPLRDGVDHSTRAITVRSPQGGPAQPEPTRSGSSWAFLHTTEPTHEPGADDQRHCRSRLDALRWRCGVVPDAASDPVSGGNRSGARQSLDGVSSRASAPVDQAPRTPAEVDAQLDRQVDAQLDRQLNAQLDRQLNAQVDAQLDRQLDRQLDVRPHRRWDALPLQPRGAGRLCRCPWRAPARAPPAPPRSDTTERQPTRPTRDALRPAT